MIYMSMKSFIITVDTEGDNLWSYVKGSKVSTCNVRYIARFQELCNRFGFKPVWLTNYEMIQSDEYVKVIQPYLERNQCEIGIHVHAWNNPPFYQLDTKYDGNSYLIEYPKEIMYSKFKTTYELIEQKLGVRAKSHRSGRWAMDNRYFKLLEDFGITCDCSYTPTIEWNDAPGETIPSGSDYRNVIKDAHMVGNILEVPATIRRYNHYLSSGTFKHKLKTLLFGGRIWLRPALNSLDEMKKLARDVSKEPENDYLEFMLHSSELMPGGSPYFQTAESIERMYRDMEKLFIYVKKLGYEGDTLQNYALRKQS